MNSFTLRPYQQKFADDIVRALVKHQKIIACAATGSGKTKTFISLAHRALAKSWCVLVMTESRKIFTQLTDELDAVHIKAGINSVRVQPGKVYVAMAQTLNRRTKLLEAFNALGTGLLIINDEAHIGTATNVLRAIPQAFLIGFTATPDWRSARHLSEIYAHCVVGPQPADLVNGGYLSSYQHFARVAADMDELKLKNGEFTEESQEQIFGTSKVFAGIINDLQTLRFNKCMIFTASIKHCTDVHEKLLANGLINIPVHSQSPADLRLFTGSGVKIAVSVGMLTKGWDFPALDLVVLNRATTSLPLYMQMIGRGSRTHTDKDKFVVLDYGENWKRHGLWDAEVDWNEKWKAQKQRAKTPGAQPIKMCPECEFILPATATVCSNCGYIFPKKTLTDNQENTKLVDLTATYRTLIGRKISSLTPQELSAYAKIKNKKPYAIRTACSLAQRQGFKYLQSFALGMGYKPAWARMKFEDLPAEPIPFHDIILR